MPKATHSFHDAERRWWRAHQAVLDFQPVSTSADVAAAILTRVDAGQDQAWRECVERRREELAAAASRARHDVYVTPPASLRDALALIDVILEDEQCDALSDAALAQAFDGLRVLLAQEVSARPADNGPAAAA